MKFLENFVNWMGFWWAHQYLNLGPNRLSNKHLKTSDFSDFPTLTMGTSSKMWSQLLPQMLPNTKKSMHGQTR